MPDFELTFPPGFLWGAATAAHQVEGNNAQNNWAAWEQTPGHIFRDQQAGLACDWWGGRYVEDFDRAAALNHNTHRFSVEWSRIEPERGKFDLDAIAQYADMLGALRARGMEPMITLHHFTNPLWIEEAGGWLNEETARRFARFVKVVVEDLGHEVSIWCTINEPMVYATMGYAFGRFPPGERSPRSAGLAVENLLRGHAAAYRAIKEIQPSASVGFAKAQVSLKPERPAWLHKPARNMVNRIFNEAFIDALMTGELRMPLHSARVPEAKDTLDWIGLNYYYRFQAGFNLLAPHQLFIRQRRPSTGMLGPDSVGEIWPEGLYEQIVWLCERTNKSLYITENGIPDADDARRPLHLIRSLRSVWGALNANYPVKGYFYWTLVDNFEWAEGYDPLFKFGLFECDPNTQQRTPKPSADLYGAICGANALTTDMIRTYAPEVLDEYFPSVDVQTEIVLPTQQ